MFKKFVIVLSMFLFANIGFCAEHIKESLINLEATVNQDITPDAAKIRFTVQNSGLNLADLKEKNDKIAANAIKAIKANLTQNEQIKTTSFNVRSIYSHKDKITVFQKYEVSNSFEVKLKELDKISKIVNIAMDHGVKIVSNVNFFVENNENVCNQMMGEAVKIAKNRAQYLSSAAGVNLDKVKTINPYCSLSSSNTIQKAFNYANKSMGSVDEARLVDTIEPGTRTARASVNMSYYIK